MHSGQQRSTRRRRARLLRTPQGQEAARAAGRLVRDAAAAPCARSDKSAAGRPARHCFERADEVRLEIGFGGGEHFVARSRAQSAHRLHRRRTVRQRHGEGVDRDRSAGLDAISGCIMATRRDLLAWLPPSSLARVDLLYPDPWPKRRHWKRRFVQDKSVAAIARVLKAGGEFRFASDISDYTAWTLVRLAALARFRLDCRTRRRLAFAVAGIRFDALRDQGQARRPAALLSDVSANVECDLRRTTDNARRTD